jgi:hypothetical protein
MDSRKDASILFDGTGHLPFGKKPHHRVGTEYMQRMSEEAAAMAVRPHQLLDSTAVGQVASPAAG